MKLSWTIGWLPVLLFTSACQDGQSASEVVPDSSAEPQASADSIDLVSPEITPAAAGEDGWDYSRIAEVDLDGDGTIERVVLTARVEMYRGQPAWDDGQPWQVYVESNDGGRTDLYAQRLQLGSLDLRITTPDDAGHRSILLIEHLPDRFAVYEASVDATGQPTVRTAVSRSLDPTGEIAGPRLP